MTITLKLDTSTKSQFGEFEVSSNESVFGNIEETPYCEVECDSITKAQKIDKWDKPLFKGHDYMVRLMVNGQDSRPNHTYKIVG